MALFHRIHDKGLLQLPLVYSDDLPRGYQNITALVIVCILCGNDYFPKKLLSHFHGMKQIAQAVADSWPRWGEWLRDAGVRPLIT